MIQLVSTYYYVYIYGPSIRKTHHAHIHHPLLRIAARHHRLPSSISERHPRRSHTLPPTVINPPPPGSLRTLVRQKTLAIAHYVIRIHLFIYPPPHKTPQDSRIHHLQLPSSPHILPASARKPRSGRSYESVCSLDSKLGVVAGSSRPPQ